MQLIVLELECNYYKNVGLVHNVFLELKLFLSKHLPYDHIRP